MRKNNTLFLDKNNFLCLSILKIWIKRIENGILHAYLFDKMFHLEFDSSQAIDLFGSEISALF